MEKISVSKKIQKIVSSLQPKKSAKSFRFKSFNISRNSSSFPHRSSFSLNSKKFLKEKQDSIQMINPNTLVYESPFFQKNKNYNELCNELKNLEIQIKINFNFKNNILDLDDEMEFKNAQKNWTLNDSGYDFNNIVEISNIIERVKKPPEKRTLKDLLEIVKFLTVTKLGKEFKEGFELQETFEKLITFCGVEIKYKFFKKGETVFRIGELPDFFYIILYGKVDILKPLAENVLMSGHQYFAYLMKLKKSKDEHLFNLCIKANKTHFRIDRDDVEILKYIYIYIVLDQINRKININFEETLKLVDMPYKDFDLDPAELSNIKYLNENLKKIKIKLPDISITTISKYLFFKETSTKKNATIYYYSSFLTLDSKSHFGDSAMDSNTTRNATIAAAEDTHTAYISCNSYFHNVVVEKVAIIDKKVHFLNSNFIFRKINPKRFEQKYFGLFIRNNYKKGDIIFKEGDKPLCVYFIEQGNVELYSSKNIYELENVIEYLENKRQTLMKKKEHNEDEVKEQDIILTYSKLNFDINDLRKDIIKKKRNKIFLLKENEDLGLISFYFGYPYIANCIVSSATAKIYQIDNKYLSDMILKENIIYKYLIKRVEEKLSLFHERLFNINNTKLLLADHLKTLDKKVEIKNALQNIDSEKTLINSKNKSKDNNDNEQFSISQNLSWSQKNDFNKTIMKINYNKFKQIVNKLQNLNLCKSINDNNNNNNFGRSNLPSINFQKIIKVTDNSPTEKPFSKKKKIIYNNNINEEGTVNNSLQLLKNNQKNILMKKNIFKNSSVANSITLKKKKFNLSNILFKSKSTTFIEEKKFCIDPVLRKSYEAYEEMNKSRYKRIQIQKNKNKNDINDNSIKKGDSIEDQKIKTQSIFYNNTKSKIRQHLYNLKPCKNKNNSVNFKSISYSRNYNNPNNSSDDEEIKKNNIANGPILDKFKSYNPVDELEKKIRQRNKINHPYFSPLVMLKKEQYKIFKDEKTLKNNMKKIKDINQTITKKRQLNKLGFIFKFINKYNPFKNP